MSQKKVRDLGRDRGRKAVKRPTRKPQFGHARARQLVFGHGPEGLKAVVGIDTDESEDPLENENDSEIEADDPDDLPESQNSESEEESNPDWLLDRYAASLGERFAFARSPTLNLRDAYRLVILPSREGGWQCRFDAPGWFTRTLGDDIAAYVDRLTLFLRATATWLEEEKQSFLTEPLPDRFVMDDFSEKQPVVHQEGFLARVNERMTNPRLGIKSSDFSRGFAKHVWLLWPGSSMPLPAFFGPTYQLAWVLGSLRQHIGDDIQIPETFNRLDRRQTDNAKRKTPRNRTFFEHLAVLGRVVNTDAELLWRQLRQSAGETG